MIYLGIDCGKQGALGVILPDGSVEAHDTPTTKPPGALYLPVEMAALLRPYAGRTDVLAVIEQVNAPRANGKVIGNVTGALQMGVGFGLWQGLLTALEIPHEVVSAAVWKRKFSLTSDKELSRVRCQALFPQAMPLLKRKMDSDRAEALLMAEYGRRRKDGRL